ncbi:2,3-bisphosphoglycerate-dependent phosphoglycerate mutase-like [Artemia franciscana]|uniref:2,3-bisphosphoglycerate-dependent phosphoglycerate mutase-like n=1 Tax=Artemia franciscana TaxID=6661 RepID=UPI0032DA89A5
MVRHGETAWNKENKRCGWFDAPSSEKGIQEADSADQTLKRKCYQFDTAHTSVLSRVQHTLKIILEEIEQSSVPVEKTWRLRGIVKHLDKLSDKAIMGINLPNRIPLCIKCYKQNPGFSSSLSISIAIKFL